MLDLATLSCDQFAPLVGSSLTLTDSISGGSFEVEIRYTRIMAHGSLRGAPRKAFSVFMSAPEPCGWADGDYIIRHPRLGEIGPVRVSRIISDDMPGVSASFQLAFN